MWIGGRTSGADRKVVGGGPKVRNPAVRGPSPGLLPARSSRRGGELVRYSSRVPDGSIPAPRRQVAMNSGSAVSHWRPRACVPVTMRETDSPTTR